MGKFDDNKLIGLLRNPVTRERAFAQVVAEYSEQLYWKIRRIVFSHDNADDVLQNTFIKAWLNLDNFEAKSKLSTWLYRIAFNEAIDFLRKEKKMSETVDVDDDNSVANTLLADDYFDGDEAQAHLQAAIAKLPEVQRVVFNLRYYEEMPYSEMSKLLGTSEGALKASYHIAVKKIRKTLESEGY